MQKVQFNYAMKNIGIPTRNQYLRSLIDKTENVVHRMRWKAHFYLNGKNCVNDYENFGLPSKRSAPPIKEMKEFEDDLVSLISNITFRNVNDPFLKKVDRDMQKVNSSKNVFVFADKTTNMYEISPENYNKLLQENITKSYKIGDNKATDDINEELRDISNHLSIGNRIDIMAQPNAFVTIKDHKENFPTNLKCRLINPAKSELGKVSKVILDRINDNIRSRLRLNQWKNSHSVIEWFKKIQDKPNHTFLSFDIVEFYPSITEILLDRVIEWAKSLTHITDEEISIIKHARKSLLFSGNTPWIKRCTESMFDVTMGSYDGAEICELVVLFILDKLSEKLGNEYVGLYRDDGLALIKGTNGRNADITRKMLHDVFQQIGLKITAQVNHQLVNFLDITLNLNNGNFAPFRKANNNPLYVNSKSNHPPSVIRQIPKSVNQRLSSLSSDQQSFDSCKPFYEHALTHSNYNVPLEYSNCNPTTISSTTKRRRQRNIIWYNPPFSKSVKTNIARSFLQLLDKHFPTANPLHKLFNRNTVKVSYSCMPNMKSIISRHNHKILSKSKTTPNQNNCNCRKPSECPMNRNCLSASIVYKAEVSTCDTGDRKEYIGMTANSFKERFNNHKKSFNNEKYEKETELSKYIWKLKKNKKDYSVSWSILKRAPAFSPGRKRCNLCIEEKLCLMQGNATKLLNKRSEIFAKCRHREKFCAGKFRRARNP